MQEYSRFIYLGFYVAFNTVPVISQRVVGRTEETSTYSLSGFCTVNCQPTASNYQLSHLRPCREPNPGLRGGRRECYHSAIVAPLVLVSNSINLKHFTLKIVISTCIRISGYLNPEHLPESEITYPSTRNYCQYRPLWLTSTDISGLHKFT